jgi:3-phosphoshikimate 1-carboxyvinyltransferase
LSKQSHISLSSVFSASLLGEAAVPGDKSISHRALIFGSMCVGETTVYGLLEAEDVLNTAQILRLLGADIFKDDSGVWHIFGVGVGGFRQPQQALDCGNSGTGARLLMGAMATTPITATFVGDASLSKRPMGRVLDPLRLFGVQTMGNSGDRLPLTLQGAQNPLPVEYTLPVASAQVKSAILLAGLNAPGETVVIEKIPTRDHTERALKGFGADIHVEGERICVRGYPDLVPQVIEVARDPSSAAFPVCAALLVEGSRVTLPGIGMNPTRTGLFQTLQEMGANLTITNQRTTGGEPVADICAQYSQLTGVEVPPERAPSMIDEYPILAAVAALAKGKTVMRGIHEPRVKESDRISAMAAGLQQCGVRVEETEDTLTVYGQDTINGSEGAIKSHFDHRIAMSFLCLGLASQKPVQVDDVTAIQTSFPDFIPLMEKLGARFQ